MAMAHAAHGTPSGSGRRTKRGRPSRSADDVAAAAAAGPDQQRPGGDRRGVIGALILGLCIFNVVDVDVHVKNASSSEGRRSLLSSLYLAGPSTLLPWAEHHLVDVMDRPDPEKETALFWHIPKSGGTTAKRLYQCMGQTLAHRVGSDPRFGHDKDDEIVIFEPHQGKDWKVANVDTTIKPGILRAKKLGLVQSHTTDLIFTMEPEFAGQNLYDEENRGRFLALFRHPVDRALSMFFYLQTATWERTYRPEWANMTVMEWATLPNFETDYMVHKLVGKSFGDTVDETDLIIAKELVRQRFVVGLMGEMNESIRRFNVILGVDVESKRGRGCMEEFGLIDKPKPPQKPADEGKAERKLEERTHATDKKNSNKHPKFEEGTPEFDAVASRNPFDMLLYKYIEALFEAQKEIIDSYLEDEEPTRIAPNAPIERKVPPERKVPIERKAPIAKAVQNQRQRDDESRQLAILPPGAALKPARNDAGMMSNLAEVNDPVQGADVETPFFWHVPKCGGTTLQRLYWCMGFTIANEVGANPKFGRYQGTRKLEAFHPWTDNPGKVINVDVATTDGIAEAKSRGFLTRPGQPHVDVISTSEFQFATKMLFSPKHKARMFAFFRHPIDRAVSKFYYLQKATWEPTYNQRWAHMTLEQWASHDRGDNNWMVRHLIGKGPHDDLSNDDLELAKEIVRTKFVVGLMDEFEESVHRFNLLLGVDEDEPGNARCIDAFVSNQGDAHSHHNKNAIKVKNQFNSYSHPEAERGSPAWVSLAKVHMYDNLLYRYILKLFDEQRPMFEMTE